MPITTRRVRLALATLALAALAACGGNDAPPVTATRFTPADGATKVDIRPTFTVAFDGPLDPASVSAAHVTVTSTGFTIPATLAYDDATHTVTVTPRTLKHATNYTLTISGLTNTSGLPVADAHATFATWVNPAIGTPDTPPVSGNTTLLDSIDFEGNPVSTYVHTEVIDGRVAKRTTFDAPGPDGVWFTADDVPFFEYSYTYDANGNLASNLGRYPGLTPAMVAAGFVDWRIEYQYDATGLLSLRKKTTGNPDGDGVIDTPDDEVEYAAFTYDASGRMLHTLYSRGPGADGTMYTADDITFADVLVPGTGGAPDLVGSYDSPGPDGDWLTAADNDLYFNYFEEVRDARGNVTRHIQHGTGGPVNGREVTDITDYVYDAHDNLVSSTQTYTEGGPPSVTLYDTTR